MVGEEGDVFGMLTEGGHGDGNDIEAVEEVKAEFFVGDGFLKVFVGGANEPDVQFDWRGAAETDEFAFLEDAEEFGLECWRKLRHFVKENGSGFGHFEQAFLLGDSAGERAALVTEQFAFEECFGEGGTIERDEGVRFAGAVEMDSTGDELLASAAFPKDQNRRIGRSDAFDELIDLAHARAAADHVVLKLDFGTEALIFAAEAFELAGVFDGDGGEAGNGGKQL